MTKTMKRLLWIWVAALAVFVLTSCGPKRAPVYESPEMEQIKKDFDEVVTEVAPETPIDDDNLEVITDDGMPPETLGHCDRVFNVITGRHHVRRIKLKRSFWNSPNVSDNEKRLILYHELIHCTLEERDHSEDDGSIMAEAPYRFLDADLQLVHYIKFERRH